VAVTCTTGFQYMFSQCVKHLNLSLSIKLSFLAWVLSQSRTSKNQQHRECADRYRMETCSGRSVRFGLGKYVSVWLLSTSLFWIFRRSFHTISFLSFTLLCVYIYIYIIYRMSVCLSPPPHARLLARVPHEAAIPSVQRDGLQPVGKWYQYLQRLLVTREYPREDPRWKDHTQWPDLETAIFCIGLSLGCSP
jgi:hypothetical protein